ncbi:MAG TPA: hypothetical protein VHW26_09905 [Solirubrobacteraceae bacterium]|nr:hypothetical protein [Solirubrobacteraceae bacterium]
MSIHIRPTAPLAERALLPADPGVALALAQAVLEGPRMFNHSHGLWGYTGLAVDGRPLTIQSTGIGGPSAAIVLDELISIGLRQAIRVGTAVGLDTTDGTPDAKPPGSSPSPALGDLVIVDAAVPADGTSRALGGGELARADDGLTRAMTTASGRTRRGRVVSADLLYGVDDDPALAGAGRAAGAVAVDLETAAVFALGARRQVAVGCVVVVWERRVDGRRVRLDDDGLAAGCEQAGRLGAAGLGARVNQLTEETWA